MLTGTTSPGSFGNGPSIALNPSWQRPRSGARARAVMSNMEASPDKESRTLPPGPAIKAMSPA
jgi:hypothetical protein